MEKGESSEETLPTVYGIMIAFLTCVVGYVLWVSFTMCDEHRFKKMFLFFDVYNKREIVDFNQL